MRRRGPAGRWRGVLSARVLVAVALSSLLALAPPGAASAFTAAVKAPATANRTTSATWFRCLDAAGGTGALLVWSLQDGSAAGLTGRGAAGAGGSGTWDGTAPGSSTDGPCPRDAQTTGSTGRSVVLTAGSGGASTQYGTSIAAASTLSFQVWFRTTTRQGLLMGLRQASPAARDRVVFLTASGRVAVGLAPASAPHAVVTSRAGTDWADGAWHHVAVTQSSSGLRLYLDGALEASDPTATTGYAYSSATPRIGQDDLSSWAADGAGNGQFIGQLAWFSASQSALPAQAVLEQCRAGRTAASLAATDPAGPACRP